MPLHSIRVLDLTRLLPGPYSTMLLADFGAEVIKVEEPNHGDYARADEPKLDEDSAFFHSINRNKKSVCLDLKSQEGKNQFLKLVKTADVVVESFRPGVMERLGLDYESIKKVNPAIIYCAITGYGQTGPYVDIPGHDINYISYAGLLHLMGEKNRKPIAPATQIADIGGGALPATVGILLAIIEQQKTGKGQLVDISMMDGVISWLQTILPYYFATNNEEKRGELALSGGKASYGVYETRDGKYLSVGALEEKFWKKFCQIIGREDFIPLLEAPVHKQHQLSYEIQTIIAGKSQAEWLELFSGIDACVAPVLTMEEMVKDPQVQAREMIQDIDHPTLGISKQIGIPIKLSETPGAIRSHAPKLGEHNDEILEKLKNRS
ncbi:Crotonobetainyl-CoA:carnitine CoA-transferase CaiB [Lentibacillus persicus]|uniref:Crotonobetainyl-CoA:carnitine CoA-transferase CaiB n=1 Tax=Lentibacillus persicus TaxID=640948 RepID=A0A1I1S929_9BACI|nr:CaiB/BaiF CoA-transferase family protein [Lentibacillus persicus]SFD43014.1 Crotonobetainyl-CoA:carnitine CoA-transferase CaiB [Lentibacillus persicus]